ncbi:hypothetical protein BCR44DRAFT_1432296 [Catenaria anguillulae PL171]|uniref:Uncharacterized protein n=1 Tax=Catenaria anguillulae PL171 TaxID=765915 RepID=A0A1Y2HPW5_9FUNG|nr:hypothetical protein BCR44DRAFT_1432296 [Catenaria anguillulae PL171]
MWHMGAVFMLRDAAMGTFFVMVLDADNSGQPGTIFDMSSASARVKEETNITVGAGGSETSSALGGSSVSPSTATSAAELNGRGAGGAEVHDGFGGGAGIICVTSTSQVRQWRQVLDATSVNGGSNSGSQTETSNPSRARGSSQQGALAAQSGTSETGGSGKTPTGTGSKTVPE